MRSLLIPLTLLAAVPCALGQNVNNTFFAGLLQTLQSAGLTTLANVATQVNATAVGQTLVASITNGAPHLLFAPTNTAFNALPANITQDPARLTDVFGYHILLGNFTGINSTYPNVTLGHSLMNDPIFVQLEGNRSQVVAWATRSDGKTHVLNQANDSTVVNSTSFGNVTILTVDNVVAIPGSLPSVLSSNTDLSALQGILSTPGVSVPAFNSTTNQSVNASLFDALSTGFRGYTLFAPNNAALTNAMATLQGLAGNTTAIQDILLNHLINASTYYSPSLVASQNLTSSAGEPFSFSVNSTGQWVTSGNVTALIVQPDVLVSNGVIHIIDRVLFNTANNTAAASSALAAATSTASQTASLTVPIAFVSTTTSSSSGSSSGSSSASPSSAAGVTTVGPSTHQVVSVGIAFAGMVLGGIMTLI